jgi:hypothetical protein
MVRNGKLYSRPILNCRIVENESLLLPTPTRSFGVNARGWGLSQTGRRRYSEAVEANAKRFGYRPPIALLEWMMGFPENHTAIELAASGMPLSLRLPNGSQGKSLNIIGDLADATPTGLTLGENLSYAEWESVGFGLAKVGKAMQWWIGDWVNYGGKRYGETYKAAIDATGMGYKTVSNFALICSEFEFPRRRGNLSFNHHVEVWSLDHSQQDELLHRAETEGLSCAKLRELVRGINCIEGDASGSVEQCDDSDNGDDHESQAEVEQLDTESWSDLCVKAFSRVDDRLSVVSEIVKSLQPHERSWLMDLLATT